MVKKTILIPVYDTISIVDLKPYFEIARDNNLHLNIQVFAIAPSPPIFTYGYSPYGMPTIPNEWQKAAQEIAREAENKVTEIEDALTKESVSTDVIRTFCELSAVSEAASELALVSDIAILSNSLRINEGAFPRILSGVLYESPIAAVVNPDSLQKVLHPKKVFIAWDASVQAAKAVQQVLPLIDENCEIHIGCFDIAANEGVRGEDPGTDIAAKLSRHGCAVTLHQYSSGGRDIADGIKRKAAELGADDLIVMGAYGHSKLRERVFGGTTQSMLDQTEQAIFFAH